MMDEEHHLASSVSTLSHSTFMASDTSSMDGRETARENNKDDSTGHIEAVRAAMSKHSQYTPDTGYQSCDASSLSSSTSLSSCSTPRALFDHREESRTGDSIDSSSSSSSSDGLFDLLHASLSTSSQSSSRPSPASTWRGSQSTRATASNCSTESRNDGTSYSSSISSSGSTSPASPKNSRSRRQSSTIAIVAAPFTPSTQAFTSAIHKTSQVATSLITIHQALSLSLYILVTLIATITLLSILVAGYGLTLADDIKYKIGKLGKKADQKRRELLFDLEEWLRITNENLKKREAALEPRHSYNQRRRRSSYPHSTRNHKADSRRFENRSEDTFKTLQLYALIAYSKLPFSTYMPKSISSWNANTRRKAKSQPSSRPRSRCSSPPSEFSFSSSNDTSNSASASSSSWSKLPPRPPLSVLIPSMMLALLLAFVALFKNGKYKRRQ